MCAAIVMAQIAPKLAILIFGLYLPVGFLFFLIFNVMHQHQKALQELFTSEPQIADSEQTNPSIQTLENNIAFGLDDPNESIVTWTAEVTRLHDEAVGFADRYQTVLGERYVILSGVQRQRTSICHAVTRRPQQFHLLIFN